jgi:hypothetical protein
MFPIEDLKKRREYLIKNGIDESFDVNLMAKKAKTKISKDWLESEDGKRACFENRDLELIIEICNFGKNK